LSAYRSRTIPVYLSLLIVAVIGWLVASGPAILDFAGAVHWTGLLGVVGLYFCTHLLRMVRLALLTLDERNKAFYLISAHALTAFPSSFLPFKLGEILRLGAFFRVYGGRRKALAVWLCERFGDILVISAFILCLHAFDVAVQKNMRTIFFLFVIVSVTGLVSLFAIAKVFVYLNRHLVLSSHSVRGLMLLRASHALRLLELGIYKSIEGRLAGFLLLSLLIWAFEAMALALFIKQLSIIPPDFAGLFISGLLASLPGGTIESTVPFGLYQSLALVVLSLTFVIAGAVAIHLEKVKPS
jgi:hypothetical protein